LKGRAPWQKDFSPKKVLNKTTQEINKTRQKIQFESIDAVKKDGKCTIAVVCPTYMTDVQEMYRHASSSWPWFGGGESNQT